MKNIHVLPTKKPSRLVLSNNNILTVIKESNYNFSHIKSVHIYITSDEEIKEGDWVIANGGIRFVASINNYKSKTFTDDGTISKQAPSSYCHLKHYKKIILTTDQDLIKDGVQSIDDEFLEWFVKNPSCEKVEVQWIKTPDGIFYHKDNVPYGCYKIIIPKEETMKQTAVDFLSEKYMYVTWLRNRDEISAEQADKMRLNYLLEAKEMEKEQSIDFARLCLNKAKDLDVLTAFINVQQYYNETYNDNK